MEHFLPSLLRDLEYRCRVLRERLSSAGGNPDVAEYALGGYRQVETVRREVERLLQEPDLTSPTLLPNYLLAFGELSQRASIVESYFLPFVERFSDRDSVLTRLTHRLTQQVRWPLDPPLVSAFSLQGYWTVAQLNLVCGPAAEADSLLGLPDLCHELGHILLLHYEPLLLREFRRDLRDYFARQQQRLRIQQRPTEYLRLYDLLYEQWRDSWVLEFGADMIATYLVGPSFGWQHVRLCAGIASEVYVPGLGERAEHPADEARLRGVVALLNRVGGEEGVGELPALWGAYSAANGANRPADYDACYPDELLENLARRVSEGCAALGIRPFPDVSDPATDIPALVNEAWDRFRGEPGSYSQWEQVTLSRIRAELGA